jgi:glutamate 5-kinase
LIREEKVLSILPVGVESFSGNFKKGDLLEILGPKNQKVGIGIARYGIDKLAQVLGQKNKPELIHYDHLHVFLNNGCLNDK